MGAVKFFTDPPDNAPLKYAVIVARYRGKWIFSKHKERITWEIPGGHIEPGETPAQAASRELWEETGTLKAEIVPVSVYGFRDLGMLYFAEISELGPIPESSEIREIGHFDGIPDNLTYPHIQPALFERVKNWLKY